MKKKGLVQWLVLLNFCILLGCSAIGAVYANDLNDEYNGHDTPKKITITFDLQGGKIPAGKEGVFHTRQTKKMYQKGDYIPTSEFDFFKGVVPTKEGEEFLGWRLQEVESKYIVTDYNWYFEDFHILQRRKPTLNFVADWKE